MEAKKRPPQGRRVRRQPSLYEVLHVHPHARPEQIRNAFRRVALRLHPDRNPSPEATSRFLRAVTAFKILSDPKKRAIYDQRRARAQNNRMGFSAVAVPTPLPPPKKPASTGSRALDTLAVILAVTLPILVGAVEAMGYHHLIYVLAVLFVVAIVRVFRIR